METQNGMIYKMHQYGTQTLYLCSDAVVMRAECGLASPERRGLPGSRCYTENLQAAYHSAFTSVQVTQCNVHWWVITVIRGCGDDNGTHRHWQRN